MCDRAFVHFSFSTKLTPDLYSPLISQLIYLQEIRNITHQEQQPQGGLPLHNIHKILDFISCAIDYQKQFAVNQPDTILDKIEQIFD